MNIQNLRAIAHPFAGLNLFKISCLNLNNPTNKCCLSQSVYSEKKQDDVYAGISSLLESGKRAKIFQMFFLID